MKLSTSLVTIPLLLLLLTWFLIRSMNADSQRFELAIDALGDFQAAESALHRDVLMARTGLLHNYDPLVLDINALKSALDRLRTAAAPDAEREAAIDRLAALADQQEDLTEEFKSGNALLQNSLAYFRLFSAHLAASGDNGTLSHLVSNLAAAMLTLTLDTSPAIASEVEDRLDDLAKQSPSSGDAESIGTLLAHGRLLHELLPKTDNIVKMLFAIPSKSEEEKLTYLTVLRHDEARNAARQFRWLLYATSLLLLAVLLHLGFRLRARAQTLRRRAAFEHIIAGISARFINTQPHEIEAHVKQALVQLSEHLGATQAFYMLSGAASHLYAWSRDGVTFAPGWPDSVAARASQMTTQSEEIIHLPPGALRLMASDQQAIDAGASRWTCVVRTRENDLRSLLGFGIPSAIPTTKWDELGLLHMALDAVSNAVARIALERERAQLEARLQQARRMEMVGSFASGIAHNFNNIVGAILGYTEIAESQAAASGQAVGNLDEIRKAGERARDLVDQILAFGRRRDGHRRLVHMPDLMAETVSLLRASLPASVDLMIAEIPEDANVLGEPAQLQQVIINLCNNAAQAMDDAGRIEIGLEIREIAWPDSLAYGELAQGRYVAMTVSDSGCGMDETILERLFEPFFTTRPTGNGLGLATVREIVREHGGAMNVRSTMGLGSCFEVWLPCIEAINATPARSLPIPQFGQGETVLVIGDDRRHVAGDEEVLAALGYEPVGYFNSADAIEAYRAMPTRFDCIILGHFASAAAALSVATTVHRLAPDLPILLTTTSIHEIELGQLLAAGIAEIARRPIISSELADALKRCLAGASTLPVGLTT